jgi:type I restriction enzyme S subunit
MGAALSGAFGEASRGVNIRHLGKKGLAGFPIPVPPLQEQKRIVAAIEEHLSRLDAGRLLLESCIPRLRVLRSTAISGALDAGGWPLVRWGDVGATLSGRAFPSASYSSEGIHLLRPGNLHSSGEVRWMNRSTAFLPVRYATENPKYHLRGRHLLMNLTAQSLADDFLGRVCLTADDDEFLLNQRIAALTSASAQPAYLYWVFRSARFRRFVATLNTGSLIQHISARQLNDFAFPLPPMHEQQGVVSQIDEQVAAIDSLEDQVGRVGSRAEPLRRSVLARAFIGDLVTQDSSDERAPLLLNRIQVDRSVATPLKRRRRTTRL